MGKDEEYTLKCSRAACTQINGHPYPYKTAVSLKAFHERNNRGHKVKGPILVIQTDQIGEQ